MSSRPGRLLLRARGPEGGANLEGACAVLCWLGVQGSGGSAADCGRDGNLLLEWALNLMVLNVSTRKYHRAVRLPEGDLAKARGDGTSKSAVSRRFVALSRKKMKAWLASDLSELDLLVIQIDGLHVGDHVLMVAIGVDGNGDKHVLAVCRPASTTARSVCPRATWRKRVATAPRSRPFPGALWRCHARR